MSKEEKRQYILDYVPDLKELAESYEECASVIDTVPDPIFEAMYKIAVTGNQIHNQIADAIEASQSQ